MFGGIFSRLARVRFTVGYVAILLAISCAILVLGPHAHDVLVQRASTNLHNLARGHLGGWCFEWRTIFHHQRSRFSRE